MKKYKIFVLSLILIVLLTTLVGCEKIIEINCKDVSNDELQLFEQKKDKECIVQLRRDLLGQSADLPTPPTIEKLNGADVQITGNFLTMTDEWIILIEDKREIWIRKENILLIQFQE